MTAKQLFATLGVLLGIISFVFTGGATALIAGGVIAVGVAVIVP